MTQLQTVFSVNLRHFLHQRGLTQVALAERLKVTQGHVSHVINGRTPPDIVFLEKIAAALEVDPTDLLKKIPR